MIDTNKKSIRQLSVDECANYQRAIEEASELMNRRIGIIRQPNMNICDIRELPASTTPPPPAPVPRQPIVRVKKAKAPKGKEEKKPKRKMGAYQAYMKVALPRYKKMQPDLEHGEAFKEVAAQWKSSVSDEEKQKYQRIADEANAAAKAAGLSKPKKADKRKGTTDPEAQAKRLKPSSALSPERVKELAASASPEVLGYYGFLREVARAPAAACADLDATLARFGNGKLLRLISRGRKNIPERTLGHGNAYKVDPSSGGQTNGEGSPRDGAGARRPASPSGAGPSHATAVAQVRQASVIAPVQVQAAPAALDPNMRTVQVHFKNHQLPSASKLRSFCLSNQWDFERVERDPNSKTLWIVFTTPEAAMACKKILKKDSPFLIPPYELNTTLMTTQEAHSPHALAAPHQPSFTHTGNPYDAPNASNAPMPWDRPLQHAAPPEQHEAPPRWSGNGAPPEKPTWPRASFAQPAGGGAQPGFTPAPRTANVYGHTREPREAHHPGPSHAGTSHARPSHAGSPFDELRATLARVLHSNPPNYELSVNDINSLRMKGEKGLQMPMNPATHKPYKLKDVLQNNMAEMFTVNVYQGGYSVALTDRGKRFATGSDKGKRVKSAPLHTLQSKQGVSKPYATLENRAKAQVNACKELATVLTDLGKTMIGAKSLEALRSFDGKSSDHKMLMSVSTMTRKLAEVVHALEPGRAR